LTAWRIKHLFNGKSSTAAGLLETDLYVNSRRESAELMLDNPEQMAELLDALKLLRPQFAIFDVFNVLHCADENDAQGARFCGSSPPSRPKSAAASESSITGTKLTRAR